MVGRRDEGDVDEGRSKARAAAYAARRSLRSGGGDWPKTNAETAVAEEKHNAQAGIRNLLSHRAGTPNVPRAAAVLCFGAPRGMRGRVDAPRTTTMKNYFRYGFALALALSAAVPAAAQPGRDTADADVAQENAARRPFDALIRHRAELGLTDGQVQRLQGIRQRLEERNAPLRAQLAERSERFRAERRTQLERMTPEQRREELRRLRQLPARQRVPADMQPLVRQMRVNIEEATHEAQGVLTAEQRLRVREILRREVRVRTDVRPGARARRPAAERRRERVQERRVREGRQP